MMSSSSSNVRLTPEQAIQLHEWQTRLEIVQDEIRKATLELNSLLDTSLTTQKHIDYLNEQSSQIEPLVQSLIRRKAELEVQIQDLQDFHDQKSEEHKERHQTLVAKEDTMDNREREVNAREISLEKIRNELSRQTDALAEEKALVHSHKQLLMKAVGQISYGNNPT